MLIRICGVSITKRSNNQTVKKYSKKINISIFKELYHSCEEERDGARQIAYCFASTG